MKRLLIVLFGTSLLLGGCKEEKTEVVNPPTEETDTNAPEQKQETKTEVKKTTTTRNQ